jgi:hypothetical protein
MAVYKNGPRRAVQYAPASSYSCGDVIVIGNTTMIAGADNPLSSTGLTVGQGALYIGGIYQVAADAAYPVGTWVLWNSNTSQVTTTSNQYTTPFGQIVAGPTGLASDGGSTGAGGYCWVDHQPISLTQDQEIAFPRNLIDGGDFTTNPFQRGTSQASDIANTLTYGPDRFAFKGGASSAINWSQVADTTLVGFSNALKWQRKAANTDTAAFNMVQALETADSVKMQGRAVTISFCAKAGANYSGGALTVNVATGTGSNQSASNLIAGSWTGQANAIAKTQSLTTAWVRYQFTGNIPATATQIGVQFQWTPTGTAGADDSVYLQGIQLEDGAYASNFEHRDLEMELALCQRYYFQINEPASGVIIGSGMISATNNETVFIPLPVQMKSAPTVTVSAGSFKFNIGGTATAVGGGFAAGSTHTANYISVVGTVNAAVGQATLLQGGGGAGTITASADF